MARRVRRGSIKNRNDEYKWWFVLWRLPNFLFEARRGDDRIDRAARWRAIFGVGTLVIVTYAYPGYIGGAQELLQTTGRLWPGVGTMLRFDTIWVTSIVYSLILSAMWIALFALLILPITRSRALSALLLHLCWPAATVVLFASQFFLIVKVIDWASPHFGNNPNLGFGESLGLLAVSAVIYIWFFKVVYLATTDVFRADDAHPLLAPFVTTGVAWTLACLALSSSGPSGVPRSIRLLVTLAGPVTVTGINVWACRRIRDRHGGRLPFLDGPQAGSRNGPVAVQGASGLSRREFAGLAVPAVVIGSAAWWAPKALAQASTRSYQAMAFMNDLPSSNTLLSGAFVNSVAFSPDGRTLAAGITDGQVLLWDVTDPARPTAPARPLSGQDGVGPVAFSPDGRILASGSDGTYNSYGAGTIQLWDAADPASPVAMGQSSTGAQGFNSLAFSPRGRILASGDLSGGVQLWDVADPARLDALARFRTDARGFVSVAFSPDGRILASGDDAGHIRLWNVADPARPTALGPLISIRHSVSSVAFSPDGRTLAASSNGGYESAAFTSGGLFDSPGYIRLWNISDPAHPTRPSPYITVGKGSAGFCSVAFSPDGRTLASGSDGSGSAGAAGRVQLWNVADPASPTALGPSLT
jgi:WD domain, G-beta repeat/WD40-like Beta Propeller Repeat